MAKLSYTMPTGSWINIRETVNEAIKSKRITQISLDAITNQASDSDIRHIDRLNKAMAKGNVTVIYPIGF